MWRLSQSRFYNDNLWISMRVKVKIKKLKELHLLLKFLYFVCLAFGFWEGKPIFYIEQIDND